MNTVNKPLIKRLAASYAKPPPHTSPTRDEAVTVPNTPTPQEENDVIFVERRDDDVIAPDAIERAIVGMQGQYSLKGWRDASGKLRQFSCHVLNMSSGVIKLAGPVSGSVGEWAIVHFDRFGQFEGPIIKSGERQFAMRIVTTIEDRKKIANKITWVENKKSPDKRRYERFVPRDPNSTLSFNDGRCTPCRIIDYSVSGVAVSADTNPELGVILKVGKIIGRVVRQFPEGFAVMFLKIQDSRTIEALFTKPVGIF